MTKISVKGLTAILLARIDVRPYDTRKHEE